MEKKFTIEEIKKYILSQDSLGDVMYNLNEANINRANESNWDDLKEWFTDKFNELAEEHSNCETIDDIEIYEENGNIVINFSVDFDDNGIHRGNMVTMTAFNEIDMDLCEIIEGGDLDLALEEAVAKHFKELEEQ